MPRRKPRYPKPVPWQPDPARWKGYMEKGKIDPSKLRSQIEPKGGWQLWDWRTLEDVPQHENSQR